MGDMEAHMWRSELEDAGHRLIAEGATLLLEERFEDGLAALDGALSLAPSLSPFAWQRGFALYYAGRYAEAAMQFALNSEVDPDDMEPVFWKFLCDSRVRGYEGARESLPEQSSDARPCMIELLELYHRGEDRIDQVIAASSGDDHMLTMAHFYCGIYLEALGKAEQSKTLLEEAVQSAGWEGYVGKLMGVHLRVLKQRIRSDALPTRRASKQEGGFSTPAIIKGMQGGWQLSLGHREGMSAGDREKAIRDMQAHVDCGVTAMDCGDIYTGVEELIGRFLRTHRTSHQLPRPVQIHTKFVPDLDHLETLDETYVRQVIQRSLNRLGLDSVDLVQFHWWDYRVRRYVDVARWLIALQKEGLFRHLGLTNFDLARTAELVEAGVPVASTQVQLSLIDHRPRTSGLLDYAKRHGIAVLAYGVLAGGFLTDAWLGKEEPTEELLLNRSLVKYRLIIKEWGGWARLQELLAVLRLIADSLGAAIAEVVIRWTLDQPGVTGCIIGARDSRHLNGTVAAATFLQLRPEHHEAIHKVLRQAKGVPGEVYALEREAKQHGSIMRCNLNRLNGPEHLEELVGRFLDGLFFFQPHEATKAGVHKYDGRLPCFSAAGISAWMTFCRRYLVELEGIRRQTLSRDQIVDLELMTSRLRLELIRSEDGFSIEHAVTSTFEALSALADERDMGEEAPSSQEREDLLERRLRGLVLEFFGWGPWDDREGGKKALAALASYVRDLGSVRGTRMADVCMATAVAARVLVVRAEANSSGVKPGGKVKRMTGVGRQKLREVVRWRHHMATETADGGDVLEELLRRAEQRFGELEGLLKETAEKIEGPGSEWKDVAKKLRKDHPSAKDLLPTYLLAMDRALSHVLQHGHVGLPAGINPRVEAYETPEAQRPFTPFGDFHKPAPFSTDRTGYLMLHPLEEDDEEGLGDHDIHWIEIIAMHEYFPGHYQQCLIAQCHPRPLRRWFIAPIFYEGWGLYVEQLGLETGFYSDPLRARLTQLRLQLWRTARVILDIKLNCGDMTYEQCCQFLQDNVLFSPQASKGEAMMYVTRPGYAISYLCGFDQIMALREERRRAMGDAFSLGRFHDEILKHGTIPISLIRFLNHEEERGPTIEVAAPAGAGKLV